MGKGLSLDELIKGFWLRFAVGKLAENAGAGGIEFENAALMVETIARELNFQIALFDAEVSDRGRSLASYLQKIRPIERTLFPAAGVQMGMKTEIEGLSTTTEGQSAPELKKNFFSRNRHAIWRLVVISILTFGLCALLLPIMTCL
jgi:hypothetical protein